MIDVTLRNNLKVLRAHKDITQEQLAAAIGVTRKTINTIERGRFTPSTILALKLAQYFEVPVEDIFYFDSGG
ncbi:helix-turn-helix transcriptional regulator [bacterium]|nr:helix-turn-helix transcriptional regulator [candidate division CSSED10-310 bacterium]